ncbi:uncharacterized protein THITE_2120936 [Thermothielavioides terrestris NRRL 8126]|uniref:Uncharacterized protein n=1 Tax=Thermothielavioides terrestris (strain ATCC 38088 / NRRL 8126) TaxID=578455 RepID=G2RE31_THETT|nr:uncharacterized protein THITE_2120936 [Thermothielavioides terrestris NRRL 8126]AEO70058.1 hypothetical protein THITE_2120936 [Thermothielavioides terrestris NRRL 8126]
MSSQFFRGPSQVLLAGCLPQLVFCVTGRFVLTRSLFLPAAVECVQGPYPPSEPAGCALFPVGHKQERDAGRQLPVQRRVLS